MKQIYSHQIKESVKAAYQAIAADFDQTRKQPWNEFEDFLKYIKSGDEVLDLACGNGRLGGFLKEKGLLVKYLGVDHNPEFLKLAKKNFPESEFKEGDLEGPGVKENHFDTLLCIAAFHHLPDVKSRHKGALAMHKALKKNGILIVTVWNLFQRKYWREWVKAIGYHLITLGRRLKWNDLWIKWSKAPLKRYYHSFFPSEFQSYFPESKWKIEEVYFTRKGKRVSFWESFNIVLVARKK